MHYLSYVAVKPNGKPLEAQVAEIMEPHREWYNEETDESGGIWDWYQAGGRWTGFFDDYEPEKDPRNIETCDLCQGSGKRNDALGLDARQRDPSYTCNGCSGKGQRVKWPTQWAAYEGDIMPIDSLTQGDDEKVPYTFFVNPDKAIEKASSWKQPDFPGWPSEKGLSAAQSSKRNHKIDEIDTRIDKEHKSAFWSQIEAMRGQGYSLIVVDYHT